jgi:hypothetical protein
MEFVARGVPVEFGQPPFAAIRRCRAVLTALVPVPEAAVNEDDRFVFNQHHVGPAGKLLSVKTETKAEPVQQRANAHFRSSVLPANAAHVPRSALARKTIFTLTLDPSPIRWARGRGAPLFCEPVFIHAEILLEGCRDGNRDSQ